MFEGFSSETIETGDTGIFIRRAGSGAPLLLLHGFPETHLMWRDVAPDLVRDFTVVCADLRGYGQSGCPALAADHEPYWCPITCPINVRAMGKPRHSPANPLSPS